MESGPLPVKRAIWVYVSLALMALPLADGAWALTFLLRTPVGLLSTALGVGTIAVALLVWLELTRQAVRRNWPTWPLVLWPLALWGLWVLGLYLR